MKKLCVGLLLVFWGVFPTRLWSQAPSGLQFRFKEPEFHSYTIPIGLGANLPTSQNATWIYAWRTAEPHQVLELGRRVLIAVEPGIPLAGLLANRPLRLPREVHPGWWVLEAPDAWIAAEEAQSLGSLPGVIACFPAPRYPWQLQDAYAPAPNDPYFPQLWHLENRNASSELLGADINVRSAWALNRGENVQVAVVDNGVELSHPDLLEGFAGGAHFNFGDQTTNAGPSLSTASHGTAVAGLLGARGNNGMGVVGVAPQAKYASWVIFQGSAFILDTVAMKSMFEAWSNVVQIQNHSWGAGGTGLFPLKPLEDAGISNAITAGRGGRGVIMVRASSNSRKLLADANVDGYASDARIITVAAARSDGRVARYSNPGACVLVAGVSAEVQEGFSSLLDSSFPSLVTTDLLGAAGANNFGPLPDSGDYRYGASGFTGTSGATPIVAGVVALMLSANPNLTYRDAQQALLLSSRQVDLADPALITNGAGLRVSYNLGYGIPDAGQAVLRAKSWISRPKLEQVTKTFAVAANSSKAIPDDGLRIEVTGTGIPGSLTSIPVTPSFGYHADVATEVCPVTPVSLADQPLGSLAGRAALVQRGGNSFVEKIQNCANAGAKLVMIYNNQGTSERSQMLATDFATVPAVMMGQTAGAELDSLIRTNTSARVRLRLLTATCTVDLTNTLICEHVKVRIQTDHTRRGDLRLTLVSPSGTRSILQRLNNDTAAGPKDWTYVAVAHFFESSAGTWKLEASDEEPANVGNVLRADLTVCGVSIRDTDRDGLDDGWEAASFGNLARKGGEDSDGDGYPNAVEQVLRTNPLASDVTFRLDVVPWSSQILRLSWPSGPTATYRILQSSQPEGPYTELETINGRFPVTDYYTFLDGSVSRLLRVERVSP